MKKNKIIICLLGLAVFLFAANLAWSQIDLRDTGPVGDLGEVISPISPSNVFPRFVNVPPYLAPIPDWNLVPGRAGQIEFSASDAEGGALSFSFVSTPNLTARGATFRQNGSSPSATLSWTPDGEDAGLNARVEIIVRDGSGNSHQRFFAVAVGESGATEVLSAPALSGPQGGVVGLPLSFGALSSSNFGRPLDYRFTWTKPDQSVIDSGWRQSNDFHVTPDVSGGYGWSAEVRSRSDLTVPHNMAFWGFRSVSSGDLAGTPNFPTLQLVSGNQFSFRFYSNPLNSGQVSNYRLSLRRGIAGPPLHQVTIPVPDPANEAPAYDYVIDIGDLSDLQGLLRGGRLITVLEIRDNRGAYHPYATNLFPLAHLFPEVLSVEVDQVTGDSAAINVVASDPCGFYSPPLKLYENDVLISEIVGDSFNLTDLIPNHSYANYSVTALNTVLGVESRPVTVPTFQTTYEACRDCWYELNGGQPIDAGEPLRQFRPLVGGTTNGQGDYIYLFNSASLGTVSGRLNFGEGDSVATARWELLTDNGWSGTSNAIARPISGGLLLHNAAKLYPDPADPEGEGVFGVSAGSQSVVDGITFPYSSTSYDTHGFIENFIFDGESWLNWYGGRNYEPFHASAVVPTWNSGEAGFAMAPDGTGILVGTTGYSITRRFRPQLTATRYSGPRGGQLWNLWNSRANNWTGGNHLPWTQGPAGADVFPTFVLDPSPNTVTQTYSRPSVTYIGKNNYLVVFGFHERSDSGRSLIAAALYNDRTRKWSWWGNDGWQTGGSYDYQPIVAGSDSDIAKVAFVSSRANQADFLYRRNGRLMSSVYQHSGNSWSRPVDLGSVDSFQAIAGPDQVTWLYYSPSGRNIYLRKRAGAGLWSSPERVYSSLDNTIEVLGGAFPGGDQAPLVLFKKNDLAGSRLHALTRSNSGGVRARLIPVSTRRSAPLAVNLDTARLRLAPEGSQVQSFTAALDIDDDGYIYGPSALYYYLRVGRWADFVSGQTKQWARFWDYLSFPAAVAVDDTRGKVYIAMDVVSGGAGRLMDSTKLRIVDIEKRTTSLGPCRGSGFCDGDTTYQPVRFQPGGLGYVMDMAVDEDRALLYLTNTLNHKIQVYNISSNTPRPARSFGQLGSANGQFKLPQGVALDPEGNIYVSDTGNHRIQKFDAEGNHLLTWGSLGRGSSELLYPAAIAVDPTYNLVYVIDRGNRILKIFDRSGNFIYAWNQWPDDSDPTTLDNMSIVGGVVADGEGAVYVGVGAHLKRFDIVSPQVDNDENGIPDSLEAGTLARRFAPLATPLVVLNEEVGDAPGDIGTGTDVLPDNPPGGGPSGSLPSPLGSALPSDPDGVDTVPMTRIELMRQIIIQMILLIMKIIRQITGLA
ncbi:MAG: NHL repeat-containing protein [Patescibacteria group bacterium]|nr:NHL repeat-containing protein [Patescibacteria group bacterium]